MTDAALMPLDMPKSSGGASPPGFPPVRPPWLRKASASGSFLAHVAIALLLLAAPEPVAPSLDSVNMDLVPEGDYIEQEAIQETPEEQIEDPNLDVPPPMVMDPEAVPIPDKKVVEKKEKKQQAQQARRAGAPGGHAQGSGQSQSICLAQIAAAMRRHAPGGSSVGPGSAHVTFHVHSGGGISIASASGTTPAHAALARRAVAASRGPSICTATYLSQSFNFR